MSYIYIYIYIYIYGTPSKARNANVVYIYIYMDLRLATLKQSLSICCTMLKHCVANRKRLFQRYQT